MTKYIPYGTQSIDEDDISSVVQALRSDFLTQGPLVPQFEDAIKSYCGAEYAVASNSATSSLHLACMALGVGPGDTVWTSAITFAASSNCALYCNASVDFVDVEPSTFNMCAQQLETKLKIAKENNCLPKVVIPVHLCGQPCEMEKIYELSQEFNFKIVEDASHAIGASYKGHKIGSCIYSDIAIFSFHPVKIITTGEGGMAVTNNQELARKLELLRSHGITRDVSQMKNSSHGPWYYEQIDLGFNYRMTDIHAALGINQIKKLDSFVATRHEIASRYDEAFSELPLQTPFQHKDAFSSYHLYVIKLDLLSIKSNHHTVFEYLRNKGIGVNLHYMPVYLHPFYQDMGFSKGYCLEAENYYKTAISIPMYPQLEAKDQTYVINSVIEAL